MNQTHTLTRHRDIQTWVSDRHGMPAIAKIRNRYGEEEAQLTFSFDRPIRRGSELMNQDDGLSPCSWTAWFAELDRQQLALKVDSIADDYELIERRQDN